MSTHVERDIARFFTRGLSPREEQRMREHCAGCERCAALYAQHVASERALLPARDEAGAPEDWRAGPREVQRAEARFERWLDAPRRRRRQLWLFAGALTAAAGVAAMLLIVPQSPVPLVDGTGDPAGHDIRGQDASGAVEDALGLRLLCAADGDSKALAELAQGGTCGTGDTLLVAWSNELSEPRWLYVLGIDQDAAGELRTHAYYPRPDEAQSLSAAAGRANQVLGRGIVLGRRHAAGTLSVAALFTRAPLTRSEVEALFDRIQAAGDDPRVAQSWRNQLGTGAGVILRRVEVRGDGPGGQERPR